MGVEGRRSHANRGKEMAVTAVGDYQPFWQVFVGVFEAFPEFQVGQRAEGADVVDSAVPMEPSNEYEVDLDLVLSSSPSLTSPFVEEFGEQTKVWHCRNVRSSFALNSSWFCVLSPRLSSVAFPVGL